MTKKGLGVVLALLLLTAAVFACAPPKDKYGTTSQELGSDAQTGFRLVELSATEYEQQAQVLAVRLSDTLSSRDAILDIAEFYEGVDRYALVNYRPSDGGDPRWIYFDFQSGRQQELAVNADLYELRSSDCIVFSDAALADGTLRFPNRTVYLRQGDSWQTLREQAWLMLPLSFQLGQIDPTAFAVLPTLEQAYLTADTLQLVFFSTAQSGPTVPFLTATCDVDAMSFRIALSSCVKTDGCSSSLKTADWASVHSAALRQSGDTVVITLALDAQTARYTCTQTARQTDNGTYTTLEIRFDRAVE